MNYNWQELATTAALQTLCEMAQRSVELEKELAELEAQNKEAVDRLKDLLLGDDGQASKEAERYLDKISKRGNQNE